MDFVAGLDTFLGLQIDLFVEFSSLQVLFFDVFEGFD